MMENENLKGLLVAAAVYFCRDGYFYNGIGIMKHYELNEVFTEEELMKVKPYINLVKDVIDGFQNSNEISKMK